MAAFEALAIRDQRKVAAIVGACVADAAAQPLHWIYSDEVLQKLTEGQTEFEFRVPSANPFYRIDTGRNTCYGDEAYVVLRSLVESGGLNLDNLTQATYDYFGPDSEYENKQPADGKQSLPINGPWRNHCIKDFLSNLQINKIPPGSLEDEQIDCTIRIIPLVALYAGHPDLLFKVEEALRILQNSDLAVVTGLAAARILEQYILNESPEHVLETVVTILSDSKRANPKELDLVVIGQIRQVLEVLSTPHIQAVSKFFKKSCNLPQGMQSAMHGLITAPGYVEGVRSTILVGGCNASRSGFIGACMAAKEGFHAIPENWRNKTLRYEEVLDLALKLVKIKI